MYILVLITQYHSYYDEIEERGPSCWWILI